MALPMELQVTAQDGAVAASGLYTWNGSFYEGPDGWYIVAISLSVWELTNHPPLGGGSTGVDYRIDYVPERPTGLYLPAPASYLPGTAMVAGLPAGDWTVTVFEEARMVLTDASFIDPPSGLEITGYTWDWGDGTPVGHGLVATHRYAVAQVYTISLTVSFSDGTAYTTTKEITMATISKVSPLMAIPNADVITITGSGLPLTGTVKIGGQAATVESSPARSATQLCVKAAAGTPLGAQTIELFSDAGTTLVVAKEGAVFLYDAASGFDRDALRLGQVKKVYIDGKHVGFTEDTVDISRKLDVKDFKPNDRTSIVKTFTVGVEDALKFTLSQVNGANLALVFGGSYDQTAQVVTLSGNDHPGEHSIAVVDSLGVVYSFPRCQITEPPTLTLSPTEHVKLPLTWRVMSLDDADATSMFIGFPA